MNPNCDGYNPMRWDCRRDGCFNYLARPKIELFCHLFPGKISFGDGDGKVEINGRLLFLEWKSEPVDIPTGQRIMYERITVGDFIATICVAGEPSTMDATHYGWFRNGRWSGWRMGDFDVVCNEIRGWVQFASRTPADWGARADSSFAMVSSSHIR